MDTKGCKAERKSIPGKLLQDPNCVFCQQRIGTGIRVAGMCFTRAMGRVGLPGRGSKIQQFQMLKVPVAAQTWLWIPSSLHWCRLGFRGQTESYPLLIANMKICGR